MFQMNISTSMEEEEQECNIGLGLGLGRSEFVPPHDQPKEHKPRIRFHLSFPHYMKGEINDEVHSFDHSSFRTDEDAECRNNGTSYSNSSSSSSSNRRKNASRKKLMLTGQQVMVLEENFQQHNILTPTKKHNLAAQLNLQPRQIEVWFQNRRARTKMKQIEIDCEFWKTYCESLRDENRRLKIELQNLRARKLGSSSFYPHLPLTMTPSCDNYERRKERSRARREEQEAL